MTIRAVSTIIRYDDEELDVPAVLPAPSSGCGTWTCSSMRPDFRVTTFLTKARLFSFSLVLQCLKAKQMNASNEWFVSSAFRAENSRERISPKPQGVGKRLPKY